MLSEEAVVTVFKLLKFLPPEKIFFIFLRMYLLFRKLFVKDFHKTIERVEKLFLNDYREVLMCVEETTTSNTM